MMLWVFNSDLTGLETPFSVEEVWNAIKLFPSNKAPGPDGFTGQFYKSCWTIIKDDVMLAFDAIRRRNFMNFCFLNTTYITLLPKEDYIMAKDFRLISLIHSFVKLFTKVLANRLRDHMNEIVYKNQSAFIKARFKQDNFMLV
jgi:hypothetical protein